MDLITSAFNEIGYADYLFDITPDQLFRVARQLDAMMGSWAASGIDVGYCYQQSPFQIDVNQLSNLPAAAVRAVYLALSLEVAPSFGKTLTQQAIVNANRAYNAMLVALAVIPSKQFNNTMLAGAGNRNFSGAGVQGVFNNPNSGYDPSELFSK